jgi:hypothetical protein
VIYYIFLPIPYTLDNLQLDPFPFRYSYE